MVWRYEYGPYLLTVLAPLLFLVFLCIYGFKNRTVPGAIPFTFLMALAILWIASDAFRLSATENISRIFWFKCEKALILPMATAGFCFAVAYAGLGQWLSRRMSVFLSVIPVIFAILILTDGIHHLVWKQIYYDGVIHTNIGEAHWAALAYGWLLSLGQLAVLMWLFTRSPRHRWIAAGLIVTLIVVRAASIFNIAGNNPFKPLDPMVLALNIALPFYAFAFFGLHMFDVVPVARNMVIDRMAAAIMVIDTEMCIADLNETAERMLNIIRNKAIGCRIETVLEALPDLLDIIRNPETRQRDIRLGNSENRWYQVSVSPLCDHRFFHLGQLVWIQDITERKQFQEQILDYQKTQAMLQERELLARELHDGIGQTLAAMQLHLSAASELLAKGETHQAASYLHRLSAVVQDAKDSVRTYLSGVKTLPPGERNFVETVKHCLETCGRNHGIHTELTVSSEIQHGCVEASVAAQLQPILQEALSNARRHGKADVAKVFLTGGDGWLHIMIEDNGQGFNLETAEHHHSFGLRSMQGRAESVGGRFAVASAPGEGARITVQIPCRKDAS
jgi:signal transduction histidine kinase